MSSRLQIDSVIDDDDEFWYVALISCLWRYDHTDGVFNYSPLCIEEFDLSDKNFKPCPCGYQVRPPRPPIAQKPRDIAFMMFELHLLPFRPSDMVLDLPILLQQYQNPQRGRPMPQLQTPLR